MLDDRDRQILSHLQENARMPNAEIARRMSMAPSAVHERIRKLERRGVITGYEVRLDPRELGLGVTGFVLATALEPLSQIDAGAALAEIEEVQEVHYIAGEDCYIVKIRSADNESLGTLIREKFGAIPGMHRTRTTLVLTTLKETTRLPLEPLVGRSDSASSTQPATPAVQHTTV